MAPALGLPPRLSFLLAAVALVVSGCQSAPRAQLDECHRLSQTLRSENAQLKDQMLALRSQNEDYSERAVDDARRLAQLEAVNQRLETSVQAYQDERTRLESAYKELVASLPGSLKPVSIDVNQKKDLRAEKPAVATHQVDPEVRKASGSSPAVNDRPRRAATRKSSHGSWAPAQADHDDNHDLNLNLNEDAANPGKSTSPRSKS